jgi:hypothetical protein
VFLKNEIDKILGNYLLRNLSFCFFCGIMWAANDLDTQEVQCQVLQLADGTVKNLYKTSQGGYNSEVIRKEEAATLYNGRPASNKMPGYKYPTENNLRDEQKKI